MQRRGRRSRAKWPTRPRPENVVPAQSHVANPSRRTVVTGSVRLRRTRLQRKALPPHSQRVPMDRADDFQGQKRHAQQKPQQGGVGQRRAPADQGGNDRRPLCVAWRKRRRRPFRCGGTTRNSYRILMSMNGDT